MTKSILYIEDNPNDQRFVKKVLSAHGYTVLVAEDGTIGLQMAEQHKPDLILVDVQMPNLNGLETARLLRQIPSCANTVIVALTAHADKYKRPLYIEAGCTEYQQKQAGIQPLLALVKRYLE